ncbi:hypothetical protein Acsp05_58130 [Actinokineospora sp. NBRC 105648]|nr:hypothetical protein Acsp05_58130 [Actinokineospora sp. NBRC 105648]
MLSADESARLLAHGAPVPLDVPDTTLVDLVEAQVGRTPHAVAVVSGADSLTYADLDTRAEALAGALAARGAGPGNLVAIALPRSADLAVAALAVLKTGAGYLPIDPDYPADRVRFVLEDAKPVAIVANADLVDLGIPRLDPQGHNGSSPRGVISADDTAYVIYTSGSTGTPKGAVVPHRAVVALFAAARARFDFGPDDVWTLFHSFAFDFSVWELWGPLLHGGTLVVVPHEVSRSPEDFLDLLDRHRVTVLNQTPSAFYQLAAADTGRTLALRVVVFGGEALDPGRLADWRARRPDGPALVNMYGITETTVHVTHRLLDDEALAASASVIGHGLPGFAVHLLDGGLRPVPDGVPGELYLGGPQLAHGYLGRPGLTATRFVADPFGTPGQRLYRSGDLARRTPTGELEFLGRADDQVKIRGFRIEPGEVESVLASAPGVTGAAVVVRTDGPAGAYLAGYVVGASAEAARAHTAALLPAHMVPAVITVLDVLPLTANGKLDRRALPAPVLARTASRAPQDDTERLLADLFAQVLHRDSVGVDDSFFELGGDSIVAIQLVGRARAAGLVLSPRQVFELRTVSELAALARRSVEPETPDESDAVGAVALTPIMRAFLERGGPFERFSQAVFVSTDAGRTDVVRAVQTLLDHHDVLRARVPDPVAELDIRPIGTVQADDVLTRATASLPEEHAAAVALLDRAAGILLRATWFDGQGVLLTFHHIATDGYSCRVLAEDFATALTGDPLPPVRTSFRGWAQDLADVDRTAEMPLWQDILVGDDPVLGARRLDPARDTRATVRETALTAPVPLLDEVTAAFHARVDEVLLAALGLAVARWRSTTSTVVAIEAHGREQHLVPGADLSRTVGWFNTQYPVRLDATGIDLAEAFAGGGPVSTMVKRVKHHLRAIPDSGIGYGLLRFRDNALPVTPEPQILVNFVGHAEPPAADPLGFGDISFGGVAPAADPDLPAGAALVANLAIMPGQQLSMALRYAPGVFTAEDVAELAGLWADALAAIAEHVRRGGGGRTPTDLPLVQATQTDIERWERRYPALRDVLPLSPLQEGLLFHARFDADAVDFYSVQLVVDLRGPLNVDRLRTAAADLVDRHPVLRTAFADDAGDPVQIVLASAAPTITSLDLRDTEALADFLVADREAGFDLTAPPLLRVTLVRLGEHDHRLVVTNHHLVLDGWSTPLVVRDLFALYESAAGERPRPYRDFLAWLARRDHQESLAAWAGVLDGVDEATLLAGPGRPDGAVLPAEVVDVVPADLTARLTAAARGCGVTLNTLLSTAWGLVLGHLTGRDDVVFGVTVSGRPPELTGVERMVGLFINTVPVRVRWSPAESGRAVATRLQDAQTAVLDHQHLGLTEIQRVTEVDAGRLFDTLMVFETFPLDHAGLLDPDLSGGLTAEVGWSRGYTHYPLTLMLMPDGDVLRIKLEYRTDLFDADTVRTVLDKVFTALTALAERPDTAVTRIDLLGSAERALVTRQTSVVSDGRVIPDLLAGHDAAALAVVCGGVSLTFGELGASSDQLAAHLVAVGVGPEVPVAVVLPRSVHVVVAMLAVWKAGGVVVPVDPAYPAERIATVLAEAAPAVAVTTRTDLGIPVVHPDQESWTGTGVPLGPVGPDSAAYIVFTSGSSGCPKGVVATHGGVVNLASAHRRAVMDPVGRAVRVLNSLSFAFDGSVDPLVWMLSGHEMHVLPDDLMGDSVGIVGYVREHRVDFLDVPPSLLELLVADGLLAGEHRPSIVATGAEAVGLALWTALAEADVTGLNFYGPTEATVDALWTIITADAEPHIGRPVAGTTAYVLDSGLNPVPTGVPGELYVGGAGVARGYVHRPADTASRFVADPFGSGGRLYRTGDLVRRTAAGTVEFLGRADDQVKVRGHRVEPGEVESVLSGLHGVNQAVVVARKDNGTRLVAYLTGQTSPEVVRAELARRLPDYLVPAAVVVLAEFPTLPNGKLDRRALPEPDYRATASRRPATPTEHRLCALFAEVLDLSEVGAEDSFFALGGHSLLATRLISRIRAEFGGGLSIRVVFDHPDVAGLAAHLDSRAAVAAPALTPRPRPAHVPLSPAQRRLWFLHRLDGPSAAYNLPFAARLTGSLDVPALRAAFDDVAARHEVLRTTFPEVDGTPVQRVLGTAPFNATAPFTVPFTVVASSEKSLAHDLAVAAGHPIALESEVPIRVALLRLDDQDHVLSLVLHHIAGDEWSTGPLLDDLATAYAAQRRGHAPDWAPLPVQYADHTLWQHEVLGDPADPGSVVSRGLAHWVETLAGVPAAITLPTDRPRPAGPAASSGRVRAKVPAETMAAVRALLADTGASELMLAHSAVATLLHRLGAGTDIPLGALVSGRSDPALDRLVGFFVNTVVLRVDLAGDPTPRELLRRVRDTALSAYAHADVPFDSVVEAVNPDRSAGHPLFQTLVDHWIPSSGTTGLDGLATTVIEPGSGTPAKFDLGFTFTADTDGGLLGSLEYDADLFDRATAEGLLDRLGRVFAALAAAPDQPLSTVDVMVAGERDLLLRQWNQPVTDVPDATLVDLFAERVVLVPHTAAVVCGTESLTFAELDARSDVLAARLAASGVGLETRVGIVLPRSVEVVVALLAVWKAGGVAVPVDPRHPAERIATVLAEAAPAVVLATRSTDVAGPVLVLDEPWSGTATPVRPRPGSAAYIVFTSGSTGRPKGVVATHQGVVNLAVAHRRALVEPLGRPVRVLNLMSFAFDGSVDPLVWMLAGHTMHVLPEGSMGDPAAIVGYVRDHRIDYVDAPPSLLELMVAEGLLDLAPAVVGTGAEAVGPALWSRLAAAEGVTAVNFYGPTECTVDALWTRITPDVAPHIGRPLANTRIHVLDTTLAPVPVGVPGELYVAGAGLARGYADRPGESAARFVADPFGSGGRIYRTGDLVRWTAAGTVEFLGRVDDQVKIRGYRVEPGEVEAALTAFPEIAQAAVVARADNGTTRLVGYLTGSAIDTGHLRDELAKSLPDYLVPAALVVLDALPLTPNGKLDRRALPAPEFTGAGTEPRTEVERLVAALFAEVLGVERVGVDDSFFALGGHSLLAARLVSRLRAELAADVSIRQVFDAPTVAGLAARIGTADNIPLRNVLARRDRPERIPLSPAQLRLWFLHRLDGPSGTYNVPYVARLQGPLDVDALRAAAHDVVDRHEILRTVYPDVGGTPYQHILTGAAVPFELIDGTDPTEFVSRPFALDTQPPIRLALLRSGPDDHVLAVVVHHIAGDEWSTAPLLGDLAAAYAARLRGQTPDWAPLPLQYTDYTLWQRDLLGSANDHDSLLSTRLRWWGDTLAGLPEAVPVPTDRPRSSTTGTRGGAVRFTVPADVVTGLRTLGHATGATDFMIAQAAVAALLHKLGAGTDIPLGALVAGRDEAALHELVGFFVNTVVLRTDLTGDPSAHELVTRVRGAALDAYANAEAPFDRVVEVLNPERAAGRHPLFQTMVDFRPADAGNPGLPGVTATPVTGEQETGAKFDLAVNLTPRPDGAFDGSVEYDADLFDKSTVDIMAERLVRVMRVLATAPGTRLSRLDVLAPAERHRLVVGWNDTATPVPDATVPGLFAAQVARTPDALAVVDGDLRLTYAELDQRADLVARALTARGVAPEQVVGVHLERSADLVAALIGVQRIGAAFVPLEPAWPARRIADIHATARLRAVISATGEGLPELDVPVLVGEPHDPGTPAATPALHPDGLAYVIYTSGSTGTPKGAMICHQAIAARLLWQREMLGFGPGDAALFKAPLGFDISINEIFLPLVTGAAVVVAEPGGERDVEYLLDLITRHRVSFTYLVASMLDMLLQLPEIAAVRASLKHVWCGGEALTPELFDRFRAGLDAVMYHGYGPAEATIGVTHEFYREGEQRHGISIGRPNPNTRAHVLDAALNPVPVGVQGELYTGGLPLGRGYVGDPAQTAARFVADPWTPGQRLYRTGDLARWTARGTLEFLGRVDHQVKIRGMRVELQEIEAALGEHDAVRQAVVTTVRGPGGATLLAAYLVTHPGQDPRGLESWLGTRLPEHMVPTAFTYLDAFPLMPSGKVDRRALPAPELASDAPVRAPVSGAEERLCAVFAEVLGRDLVAPDDSFFALGGDSIASIQLVSKARAAGLRISPRDVFDHRTPAALALVSDSRSETAAPERLAPVGDVPLTPIMRAVLARDGLRRRYAQSVVLTAPDDLDVERLARAVDVLVRTHDVLRASMARVDGEWVMTIPPAGDTAGLVRRGSGDVRAELDAAADRLAPERGVVLQVVAIDRGPVLLVAHHLVVDGVSWRILVPDLVEAYRSLRLDPPATSFRHWAHGLVAAAGRPERVAELPQWLSEPEEPLGSRPLDPTRDTIGSLRSVRVQVPVEVSDALLTTVPEAFYAGVEDILLTALGLAVASRRARPIVSVDLEGHGREEHVVPGAELSRTVGWFTTQYPVRLDLTSVDVVDAFAGGVQAGDAVKLVKESLRALPDRGIGYGLLRHLNLDTATELTAPAPQILFNYLGRYGTDGQTGPWTQSAEFADLAGVSDLDAPAPAALEVTALTEDIPAGPVLRSTWSYPDGVFTHDEVVALADAWARALRALVDHTRRAGGGHTPSDMPLVSIDQGRLDAFEAKWGAP